MPKKTVLTPFYINLLIIVLLIASCFCCLYCGDVTENLKEPEIATCAESEHGCCPDGKTTRENQEGSNCPKKAPDDKEKFLDWSVYNPPISNGFTPQWWNNMRKNLSGNGSNALVYNGLGYNNRSQAFYNQGWYPNMAMPPQVIGCGGRRGPCLGGTQEVIPVVNQPIEISERNIAPVNIQAGLYDDFNQVGVQRQVGVLYKVFGSLNDVLPLYGIKRYRNSDTWDYSTKVGKVGNFVQVKVITPRESNNQLSTNSEVFIDGNSGRYRITMYDDDYPRYNPYFK